MTTRGILAVAGMAALFGAIPARSYQRNRPKSQRTANWRHKKRRQKLALASKRRNRT